MAGPGCPPPPSRAGEGGRSGGHTESGSRGRPRRPPAVTIARLHAAAAAADDDDRPNRPRPRQPARRRTRVTPTRSGERSQPLARGETPTWLPPSPLLPLPLLRLLHPPPPFPGSRPTAQPRSQRERSPAPWRPAPCALRLRAPAWRGRAARPYPAPAAASSRGSGPARGCYGAVPEKVRPPPRPRERPAEGSSCSLVTPATTKFDVAASCPLLSRRLILPLSLGWAGSW
nr:lysine-rich arabinogalactan protein 18-like [Camelus dromedarius]XP_031322743.1 lysine-rich arabinogalactan protein 18-like [Camelus dromedarius]XP_031322744.1 lysine-rich arabinogalactan protein 18-like [Camelus dromedarius]XP_031322745.1 lysine-rich arabinogalactan protein 18-like [Camelus dromedarius]XP_031322746.1 lysine-rich arabinogalactan protein 18-like [Camelus dromedarius]XP_031322747.1 lysine-rich arabinogalactan protein 18-like [Camelus dromedarius]XP_031322748.1 lysine-rich ar